jgi:mRNA interferase RelE/StbE
VLKLDLSKQSLKFVQYLPPKQFRQVLNKILELMSDPYPLDSIKLKGPQYKRTDSGEYRIIYNVENDCVKVYYTGKRNDADVYKLLNKK